MKRSVAIAFLCLAAAVLALPATAQQGFWLGVKGGYGSPSPDVSTELDILKATEDDGGVVAGLSFEGGWWKGLTLEGELLYARRGTTNTYFGDYNDYGQYQGDVVAEYTFTTLEIPLHVKYAFTQGSVRPFVVGGVNATIPLDIESENRADGRTSTEDAKDQFESAWFALEAGAGIDIKAGATTVLTLEGRYVYGLTNAAALSSDTWKWRDVRLLAGLKFRM